MEDDNVQLKKGIKNILKTLDSRGILHSIASKNNYDDAMCKLKELGIQKYFLYPEINWNAKSISIERIQRNLNIGIDSFLFIDDQSFELDEVKNTHRKIECMNALEYNTLLADKRLNTKLNTKDSKRRRLMYLEDMYRKKDEENFIGPAEKFLESLEMQFIISHAKEEDLMRVEELTTRTNQLNSTGKTYSREQLQSYIDSDKHKLLVCELKDRYGSYGKIGLALIEENEKHLHLRLLLMSCRVISRGVGTILLSYIMQYAKQNEKELLADFRKTNKNKMMYIAYKFANFKEVNGESTEINVLKNDLTFIQKFPPYIKVDIEEKIL